jgi:aryl-alcohol dehydrogenase-like predicted oxidoreductase
VPYSPLGRGFLTGAIKSAADLGPSDARMQRYPRFTAEAMPKNLELVERVRAIAQKLGATPGQLALAWVLSRGEDIVPIPGTKRRKYLDENLGALAVHLSAQDQAALESVMPLGAVAGTRYPERGMLTVNL